MPYLSPHECCDLTSRLRPCCKLSHLSVSGTSLSCKLVSNETWAGAPLSMARMFSTCSALNTPDSTTSSTATSTVLSPLRAGRRQSAYDALSPPAWRIRLDSNESVARACRRKGCRCAAPPACTVPRGCNSLSHRDKRRARDWRGDHIAGDDTD